MTPNQHSDGRPQRRQTDAPHSIVWWLKWAAGIAAALMVLGTFVGIVGARSYQMAMAPVHREISASADTIMGTVRKNRWETRREMDSLRTSMVSNHDAVMTELHDIHRLLLDRSIR